MKKIPMRTCVVSREKLPKKDLIRIVVNENQVIVDESGKVNGHGCYLKKDKEVILTAKNKKILNRILETNVDDSIYEELLNLVDKN